MSVSLQCAVVIEELGVDKCTVNRRTVLKNAFLAAVRDDLRQLVIRITPIEVAKSNKTVVRSMGYPIMELELHKRFVSQGKASIHLPKHSVRLMLSNCPPDKLRLFLATVRSKHAAGQHVLRRKPPIPNAPPTSLSLLDEVSPLRLPSAKRTISSPNISRISYAEGNPSYPTSVSVGSKATTVRANSTPVRNERPSFSHVLGPRERRSAGSNSSVKDLQMEVIDSVKRGQNVFCTGGAGTGKSHLIRRIIGILPPDNTAITASTGTAANLIGGTTVHAFSGLGGLLCTDMDDASWFASVRKRLHQSAALVNRWCKVKHLIIDEISMLGAQLFTRLEMLAREARCPSSEEVDSDAIYCSQPAFGGIQIIVFGDFFQLPPVSRKGEAEFAFESLAWNRCQFNSIELQHSYRQANDPQLARLLKATREGNCPGWVTSLLRSRCLPVPADHGSTNGLLPTRLCTHRSDADTWNVGMLDELPGEEKIFNAHDSGSQNAIQVLNTICPAPSVIRLKVGCQVMLLRNLDTSRGLVNGACGVIERFSSDGGLPQVRFTVSKLGSSSGKPQHVVHTVQRERWNIQLSGAVGQVDAYRRQIPLGLAWAVSIHKSQGISLDSAELALSKVFECGQAYVALSRCRTLGGLYLMDWRPDVIRASPKVIQFYQTIRERQTKGNLLNDADLSLSPIRRVSR